VFQLDVLPATLTLVSGRDVYQDASLAKSGSAPKMNAHV
jgi:hypothetical protein